MRGGDDFRMGLLNSGSEVPHRGGRGGGGGLGLIRYTIFWLDSEVASKLNRLQLGLFNFCNCDTCNNIGTILELSAPFVSCP